MIIVGTAGWSIPRASAVGFPGEGTHLHRYARVLRGVEINSSFHRDHARSTYENWARQTPRAFRFAVKLPRSITHDARLRNPGRPLRHFFDSAGGLGRRLGPIVVQLPPSLAFEARVARRFLTHLRELHQGWVVCEPRHPTWFEPRVGQLLSAHHVGRVAADPAITPAAAHPGGWPGIAYFRLHGSPRRYWSVYETHRLAEWRGEVQALPRGTATWVVFDNTAGGGATANALQFLGI